MDDYYEILQVSRRADPEVIKAAYNRLALKYHPDRNPADTSAEKMMKRLNESWSVVGDPSARSVYDRKREEEAVHQRQQEKEKTQQAEPKREAAAEGERRNNQTRRPDIKAPQPGNNSGTQKTDSSPDLVDGIALLIATGGGITILVGVMGVIDIMGKGSNNDSWMTVLFVLVGGGLTLAEGLGLNARKSWAISVALSLCVATTIAQGILFISNWSNTPPWAVFPFAFFLAADLFFISVGREWDKQRRSLH